MRHSSKAFSNPAASNQIAMKAVPLFGHIDFREPVKGLWKMGEAHTIGNLSVGAGVAGRAFMAARMWGEVSP